MALQLCLYVPLSEALRFRPLTLTDSDVGPADSGSGLDFGQDIRNEVLLMQELVEPFLETLRHCSDLLDATD